MSYDRELEPSEITVACPQCNAPKGTACDSVFSHIDRKRAHGRARHIEVTTKTIQESDRCSPRELAEKIVDALRASELELLETAKAGRRRS